MPTPIRLLAVAIALIAATFSVHAQSGIVTHVSAVEAEKILKENPEIIVLDVRTPWEYKGGHIEGAVNINYLSFKFKDRIAALDPSLRYVIHCKTGPRSTRALKILKEAGFSQLIHMDGGIDSWKEAKLPVVK